MECTFIKHQYKATLAIDNVSELRGPNRIVFAAGSERSSVAPAQPERPPPPLPPPRFPNSGV
ncbi:glucose transporter type 1 isoform X10 [Vespula maculifrons]|uniref:Glucose transporter type 1 isoform X10 n=1 Tax=Vespula maculifrons TaxID=7453 RepID=A0ABD2CRL5_VESMC